MPRTLVARGTTHLVLSREGRQVEDFSPVPGEKGGLLVSMVALNLTGQTGVLVVLGLLDLPATALAAMGTAFAVSAARMLFGPFLSHRRLMGPPAQRLRGTVEVADGTVTAPGLDEPAVLVRTVFSEALRSGWPSPVMQEDVRGVPFLLRFADGTAARIEPTTLHLLEKLRPVPWLTSEERQALRAPWRGPFRKTVLQTALHPGDQLEVVGRLETDVHQAGIAAPARGVPLVTFLRPLSGQVIWARRTARRG